MFIVRFHNIEQRDIILKEGFQFFDKKPMIVKSWNSDMNFHKDDLKIVHMWIQLPALDLKYYGGKCLFKLVPGIGKAIKLDQATINKDRLQYAIIMVEAKVTRVSLST